jgi:small GTP-binding protein
VPSSGWKALRQLRGHEEEIGRLAWSPDGKYLASPSVDGRVVVWDTAAGKPVHEIEVGRAIAAVGWAPDGRTLAVSARDQQIDFEDPEDSDDPELLALSAFEEHERSGPPGEGRSHASDLVVPFSQRGLALHLRLFDLESGLQVAALGSPGLSTWPWDLVWHPDGQRLVSVSPEGVARWQARDGQYLGGVEDGDRAIDCVAITSDGLLLAAGTQGGDILTWNADTGELLKEVSGDGGSYLTAEFAPGTSRLALGSDGGTVEVWDLDLPDPWIRTLEGHTGPVTGVSFSSDGRLLATASQDNTVKLWDTNNWALLGERKADAGDWEIGGLAFAPVGYQLAWLSDFGRVIRLSDLDLPVLMARQPERQTVHYANAKVVLVGDSGVGKSGLGLVLAGERFRPTESTHRRNVWSLSSYEVGGKAPERREVFLWDLAGQPGYRLLHQLHLADVAVAVVVFDARNEVDPLAGVRYWARALKQAERKVGGTEHIARLLVAARVDRGAPQATDDEIRAVTRDFGFAPMIATSAKEGRGVETLRERISQSIDWGRLPRVSSTGLFEAIKSFLINQRDESPVLVAEETLRSQFDDTPAGASHKGDLADEFRTCVDRVQARGLVRRLSFGKLILLRPEVLDSYAAAVLHAAREDAEGMGTIAEDKVRNAEFAIPADHRIQDPTQESLLLIATIQDLLHHEVALREDFGDGTHLVFPTQSRRSPQGEEQGDVWCSLEFEGSTDHIYATLVVRLAHSSVFHDEGVWSNAARFRGPGGVTGVRLSETEEGRGRLELFSAGSADETTLRTFQAFVEDHVHRRAIDASVTVNLVLSCPACGFALPEEIVEAAHDRGTSTVNCPMCPGQVHLDAYPAEEDTEPAVRQMEAAADEERARVTARTQVQGKERVRDFDVFLAHNSLDKSLAEDLADLLRDSGLNPWLDSEQIPPGRWYQDVIQEATSRVRSAAILIGEHGLGRWEALELRTFVAACVEEEDIPVIPVLLPGGVIPAETPFLKQLRVVTFNRSVHEPKALRDLEWGITGEREAVRQRVS